jgi:hypothetical protein
MSGAKRSRGRQQQHDEDEEYAYYDEGADATESARKRRMARQRLDFQPQGRRRHDAGWWQGP